MSDLNSGGGGGEIRVNLFGSVPLPGEPGNIELALETEIEIPDALILEASIKKPRKKRG